MFRLPVTVIARPRPVSTSPSSRNSMSARDRAGVHAQHGGQIAFLWHPLAGLGLAVGGRAADLGGYLLVSSVGSERSTALNIKRTEA